MTEQSFKIKKTKTQSNADSFLEIGKTYSFKARDSVYIGRLIDTNNLELLIDQCGPDKIKIILFRANLVGAIDGNKWFGNL